MELSQTGVSCGRSIGDDAEDIQSSSIQVREGDLVVLATDGLFDNLFDYEITAITGMSVSPRESKLLKQGDLRLTTPPKDVARGLALAAYWKSLDPHARTPFAREARRKCQSHVLPLLTGGKEDDITVVVAWVSYQEDLLKHAQTIHKFHARHTRKTKKHTRRKK
eukprot:GHVT01006153.1.p2 GENE.GHVT01006153.1~~GHVT01006153.1.p2  ORF type:complete len:165 (+),score=46.38 GHVT01006153.1:197-691(+)